MSGPLTAYVLGRHEYRRESFRRVWGEMGAPHVHAGEVLG